MAELSTRFVPEELRDAATYATAALHALAREEALERRTPPRLLEPSMATWQQFRGRLTPTDLLDLLLEDAAVTQPAAFQPPADVGALAQLPVSAVDEWLEALRDLDLTAEGSEYLHSQAKRLGIATRMARSELHRLRPHHRVLELPRSGGQLAYHLVTSQDDLFLQQNFTIACHDWRDATLGALVAVELGVSGDAPTAIDPELEGARSAQPTFDYVVGLHPDKGGSFEQGELQEWFPDATVLLV